MPARRVALLTHEPFYPPSGGGSAEAVYLVQELVRRGHEVHLFCPSFPDAPGVAEQFGVRLHLFTAWAMGRYTPLRNFKYIAYPFRLRRMVERAARTAPFDLILSQHAISAVAAGWLKQSLGTPVVMNFLDYLTGFMETWPRYRAPRAAIRRLERFELSLPSRYGADGVMTVSDTLADYFARTGYPRERLQPIYYGYDAGLFRYAASESAARPAVPLVVMHGSFDRHHLGGIARDALAVVARTRPEVRFLFVGQETPALTGFRRKTRAVAPGLAVECTGFVPYAEVAAHLARASVGMVPYEESTGVHCAFVAKIVEYLGVGLPVVSTPLDSVRRYFSSQPLVRFAPFAGPEFGRRILEWLDEPVERRRALGRAASEQVRAELDWGPISRKAIDFVERFWRSKRDD